MRPSLTLPLATVLLALVIGSSLPPSPAAHQEPAAPLKDLQKQRVDLIKERIGLAEKAAKAGAGPGDQVKLWEERLAVATAEMGGKTDDLRTIYERRVAGLREAEQAAEKQFKAGAGSMAEVLDARYARLEAEIMLARLK